MPYEVKQSKAYGRSALEVVAAAAEAMVQLGGKLAMGNDPNRGRVEANFNKTLAGKAFSNRVQLIVQVTTQTDANCELILEAYPVDPVGRPLRFGVLGDPARMVADAFVAQLDERLASTGP